MTAVPISTGLATDFFKSAAKSPRTFRSAFGEVLDNSIAATSSTASGFSVHVYLREDLPKPGFIEFTIADDGDGMPKSFVENGLFLLGPRSLALGGPYAYLNQFGFGLKYSLAWLTDELGLKFDLRTAHRSPPSLKPEYTCVHETLSTTGMQADPCPPGVVGTVKHFNEGIRAPGPDPLIGTRLRFATSKHKAYAGWESFGVDRSKVDFRKFVLLLREQIGLTYRDFLPTSAFTGSTLSNSIDLRAFASGSRKPVSHSVLPVPVPFAPGLSRQSKFTIAAGRSSAKVVYRRGKLDTGVTRLVYHKKAELTQGFDIVVGHKVIESAVLDRVWNRGRHDSLNYLTGEVSVEVASGELPLVSTKDSIDWSSDFARELVKRIRKLDSNATQLVQSFAPPAPGRKKASHRLWSGDENALRDLLRDELENISKGATKVEHCPWDNATTGIESEVAADLTFEAPARFLVVEAKWPVARVRDIYQLRFYWDGFCYTANHTTPPAVPHPTVGLLVAREFRPGVDWLAKYLSLQRCPCGQPYAIRICGWRNLGLPPRLAGGTANSTKVAAELAKWLK
jgi:hypothetical protein